ncbi:hypothetical protein M23134_06022 [Microscilla marina ATCC 23134]|uniref:Uncharacterized protein n=1 Tax=Microscilla marina ATCC 23134 TaxID=313606 RepID=A1ZU36_MICM2|nr:hypothetical protein M23134_06022 [Microscilla marina ATCC 23134]
MDKIFVLYKKPLTIEKYVTFINFGFKNNASFLRIKHAFFKLVMLQS